MVEIALRRGSSADGIAAVLVPCLDQGAQPPRNPVTGRRVLVAARRPRVGWAAAAQRMDSLPGRGHRIGQGGLQCGTRAASSGLSSGYRGKVSQDGHRNGDRDPAQHPGTRPGPWTRGSGGTRRAGRRAAAARRPDASDREQLAHRVRDQDSPLAPWVGGSRLGQFPSRFGGDRADPGHLPRLTGLPSQGAPRHAERRPSVSGPVGRAGEPRDLARTGDVRPAPGHAPEPRISG